MAFYVGFGKPMKHYIKVEVDLRRFAAQRFARTRFDLTANSSSFSLRIVSFIIVIVKIILRSHGSKLNPFLIYVKEVMTKRLFKLLEVMILMELNRCDDLDIIFDGSYDLDVKPYGRDDLDGVKPDGSDDDKVGNNTEDCQAHVQDDHQPALVIMITIFDTTTNLT